MHPGVSHHRDEAVRSISTVNFNRLGYPKTIWRDSNPDFHWMLINPVQFKFWDCFSYGSFSFPTAHGLHLTDVWIKSLSICQIQTVHFAALLWLILIQTSLRKRMDNYCLQLMFACSLTTFMRKVAIGLGDTIFHVNAEMCQPADILLTCYFITASNVAFSVIFIMH